MPAFILHQYTRSPYSQKIRSLLGYTQLPWQQVETPIMLPRPQLTPISGGYRRIPVAQMGADVFCDSRLIAQKVAQLSGKPHLCEITEATKQLHDFADSELFGFAIASCMDSKSMKSLGQGLSLWQKLKILADRYKMAKGTRMAKLSPKHSRQALLNFLGEFERDLTSPFRLGDEPTVLDFSIYHCLWFVKDQAQSPIIDAFPKVLAWMERIAAFGDGNAAELSPNDALRQAYEAAPVAIEAESTLDLELLGKKAEIIPDDYGQVPTRGRLVFSNTDQRTLAIDGPKTGQIHIHFPQVGYLIKLC